MCSFTTHWQILKKDKLPLNTYKLTLLYNPSRYIKVVINDVFGMAFTSNTKGKCEKIDALQFFKHIGCWVGKSSLKTHKRTS